MTGMSRAAAAVELKRITRRARMGVARELGAGARQVMGDTGAVGVRQGTLASTRQVRVSLGAIGVWTRSSRSGISIPIVLIKMCARSCKVSGILVGCGRRKAGVMRWDFIVNLE